jgi:hypothetical protein
MTRNLTTLKSEPEELVEGMTDEDAGELVLAAADAERDLPGSGSEYLRHALAPVPCPEMGAGHELVLPTDSPGQSVLRKTLDQPTFVSANASRTRLALAQKTGSVTMALDMAETIGAQNSAEQMLAHQMAAAHANAMRLLERMQDVTRDKYMTSDESVNTGVARLAGAAARLMSSYQQGLLTLHRLRTGGRQEVRVIHQQVQVNEGGQAVVAGSMGGGPPRRKQRGAGDENER